VESADVKPPNVVAHDDENVGLFGYFRRRHPWERDWHEGDIKPGSVVTEQGQMFKPRW
jgi:hypothetical protein